MTQVSWADWQLLHGCFCITSHRTLRRLHSLHACLALAFLLTPLISSESSRASHV